MDDDPEVMEKWINTATNHGVNALIFDWYWFDGQPFLESSVNTFIKARNNEQMQFYIIWANHSAKAFKIEAMKRGLVNTPRDWNKVTKDTGVGNPSKASPEKARKMLEVLIPIISDFLVELSVTDVNDIYEE